MTDLPPLTPEALDELRAQANADLQRELSARWCDRILRLLDRLETLAIKRDADRADRDTWKESSDEWARKYLAARAEVVRLTPPPEHPRWPDGVPVMIGQRLTVRPGGSYSHSVTAIRRSFTAGGTVSLGVRDEGMHWWPLPDLTRLDPEEAKHQ